VLCTLFVFAAAFLCCQENVGPFAKLLAQVLPKFPPPFLCRLHGLLLPFQMWVLSHSFHNIPMAYYSNAFCFNVQPGVKAAGGSSTIYLHVRSQVLSLCNMPRPLFNPSKKSIITWMPISSSSPERPILIENP
jgi:hypothetical protein